MMFARLHPIPQQPGTRLPKLALGFALVPLICCLPPALAQSEAPTCQVQMSLSFEQRNTMANVAATIENTMCAASSGDYELGVTYKDASGELQTNQINEKWQRSDDKTIKFTANYPIPENSDLIRVKVRKVRCVCAPAAPP